MDRGTSHLSPLPEGAVLIAWHTQEDVQAVRLANQEEALLIAGRRVPLDPARDWHPSQLVINIAREGKRAGRALIKSLSSRKEA